MVEHSQKKKKKKFACGENATSVLSDRCLCSDVSTIWMQYYITAMFTNLHICNIMRIIALYQFL